MRPATQPHLTLLIVAFVASGFSGLLYQTIWQRVLAFFGGADVYSVTITVAAFMGGLGLGSLVGGHLADRVGRKASLRLFAVAELAIGLFAVVSIPLLYELLYRRLGSRFDSPGVVAFVLFAVLLWPTFFMGLSLPLLSKAVVVHREEAAARIALLYGFNTLGAALGSIVGIWILVRHFGFGAATAVGAALNFACALAAWLVSSRGPLPGAPAVDLALEPATTPERSSAPGWGFGAWIAVYLVSGFVALSLEILWFRVLGVILKSNAFTFATLLGMFLLGLGLGSVCGLSWAERARRADQAFFWIQGGISLYAGLALIALLKGVEGFQFLHPVSEYLASYEAIEIGTSLRAVQAWLLAAGQVSDSVRDLAWRFFLLYAALPSFLLLPPTFLMGVSFPMLQKAVQTDLHHLGRRIGWLQASNIVGSTAGAFLTGLLLMDRVGVAGTLRLLIGCGAGFLILGVLRASPAGVRRVKGLTSVLLGTALLLVLSPGSAALWAALHGTAPAKILFDENGSGLSVLKKNPPDPAVAVFANGLGQSWLPFGGIHTVLGALPVLLHPRPESVVVIGLGSGDTVFAAGGRPETQRLYCIEIIGSQIRSLRRLDAETQLPGLRALLNDPRLDLRKGDGRTFLMRSQEHFDVIEADALRPNNAYAGNLYSTEYFALLRSRLRPGGFAVTWAPTERIRNSFFVSFPYALAFEGILVGSESPIAFDVEAVRRRVRDHAIDRYYREAGVQLDDLLSRYLDRPPLVMEPGTRRPGLDDLNHDLFPRDEFLTPRR